MRAPLLAVVALTTVAPAARAERTLEEYRHFRALSIDLVGRMPTREEIAAFEAPGFDLDRFVDDHLAGRAYEERVARVFVDLLRLEVPPSVQPRPLAASLRRVAVIGPDGKRTYVWFRQNQRRARPETDGEFCLTKSESGLQVPFERAPLGEPIPVPQAALEAHTVLVKPWWLYRDYRTATPVLLYGDTWTTADPLFQPTKDLLTDVDGKTRVTAVRVCREEAQTAATGTIYASGRKKPPKGPPPYDRLRQLPFDDPWTLLHAGQPIACHATSAHALSIDCGCGVGLERCSPSDLSPFVFPRHAPLGLELPVDLVAQPTFEWTKLWWATEATQFVAALVREDRSARELLTAQWTMVNGPLAQFYRSGSAPYAGRGLVHGLFEDAEPLFEPAAAPATLLPHDVSTWEYVPSRGPHAAGLLTMPAFLAKFASRRARAAAVWSAFLCRSFVAENVKLMPSNEPDLSLRPGCSTCHATLEPLAAHFSRVLEGDWRWLPAKPFPVENPACALGPKGNAPPSCRDYYDPVFSTTKLGLLRGAHGSKVNVEAGPRGLAAAIVASAEFDRCMVDRIASSFLGRAMGSDDASLVSSLVGAFGKSGGKLRALVREIVKSEAYRRANVIGTGGKS